MARRLPEVIPRRRNLISDVNNDSNDAHSEPPPPRTCRSRTLDIANRDPAESRRGRPTNQHDRRPAAALGEGLLGLTTRAKPAPDPTDRTPSEHRGRFLVLHRTSPPTIQLETTVDPSFLPRGLILGFTIAATVGPISLLTTPRTPAHCRLYGLASGIG